MRRNALPLCLCVFLFFILVWSSPCIYGERISERIQLNGFISQGYLYSTHNDFIPQASEHGSYEFSELGLTFSVDVSKKLRLGIQLLARDFGHIGNHQVILDWGFADYRFSNAFGIRVGKIKTPLGFYNEVRDTDPLFPMVILPQSVYDEAYRPVFIAYNGIGFYGKLNIGVGSLSYHLFTGGVNHPDDAPYLTQIKDLVNRGLAPTGMSISPVQMDTQSFLGVRVIWNTPITGLRLGGSFDYLTGTFNSRLTIPMSSPETVYGSLKVKEFFILSGEWAIGNFTITTEYMEFPPILHLGLFGEEMLLTDDTQQGWYIMGSYVFGDKLILYAYYDRYIDVKGDPEGNSAVESGLERIFGWQKDLVMGARFDINFNWTLKAEWHFIDGVAKSAVFFPDAAHPVQKWNMLALKMSYNF
ncbi:MAG: hypothetical protein JSV88_06710 [Candidatus Aminicenantes bacterium]|nr:MAG: hypothetical protein JSV88_06710 [Candidatus Aminicenantes bacterium]